MAGEKFLDQRLTRGQFLALPLAIALMRGLSASTAYASSPSEDTPLAPGPVIEVITTPLESRGTPAGRAFGLQRATKPLEIPQGSGVLLRFSTTAQLPEGSSSRQGAGLSMDNGLSADDPNFSRTLFMRLANPEGDTWGVGELTGGRIERILTIAPGSETMDFEVDPSRDGSEGTIIANGENTLTYALRHPFFNTGRLAFAAYSEGQAIATINSLEATLRGS